MIKGALFDLDGTLVNTIDDIAFAMNYALRCHGLGEYKTDEYRYFVGNGARILAQRVTASRPELTGAVLSDYQAYYGAHCLIRSKPYEGIPELLQKLKERKLKLMVLSNKPDQDTKHVISHYFGDDIFDHVQGQRPDVPIKPDPLAACTAAQALGLRPEEVVYLGDTAVDMTCACRAGMHGVGVLWGFRDREELEQSGASDVIARPDELLTLPVMTR